MSNKNKTAVLCALVIGLSLAGRSDADAAESPITVRSVVLRPLDEAEVPAEVRGVLRTLLVEEGQRVDAGDALGELDAREAELAVARAQIESDRAAADAKNQVRVRYADKASEVAKAELRRSGESIDKFAKSISESQLDVERLTVEKLALEREEAEHELEMLAFDARLKANELETAKLVLQRHRITAPFAGRVVLVRARRGEWIEAGTPVLRLVATDQLRAEGFLESSLATPSLVGSEVSFRLQTSSGEQADGRAFRGRLVFVSPEIDPVTRQVRVWAKIDNTAGGLRPGEQGELVLLPSDTDHQAEATR